MRYVLAFTSALFISPSASAQEDANDIVVLGQNGKPYALSPEQLRGAIAAYERNRMQFAPQARLVWRIVPASAAKEATISLRDGDQAIPLDIDANGTFTLPHQLLLPGHYKSNLWQ